MYEILLSGRGAFFALIILGLDVWALVKTWRGAGSTAAKTSWSLVIVLLPLFGLVVWALAGPATRKPEVYRHEPP
jgi:hypothetical protein